MVPMVISPNNAGAVDIAKDKTHNDIFLVLVTTRLPSVKYFTSQATNFY